MKRVFKDTPIDEITLRRFEKPASEDLKALTRKFLISIGLLQSGDSRDIISSLFYLFVKAGKRQEFLEIEDIIKKFEGEDGGTASNIRRHLRRLKGANLVERTAYGYRIIEFMPLKELFSKNIMNYSVQPIIDRISEYAEKIDEISHS
ncbi:hypothetical protein COS83_05195 [archaeon CG07_land_8_20_14_0_80_38_8]|nr:MAG: hypothetical protein COS83_05195 [archaeon CG07_land_8_20_14_0_80_38_8]PIU88332.1 MAG: hypothetical protein COS64_04135 [archaeon CG06_land_8_20_14_3_00_37_11]